MSALNQGRQSPEPAGQIEAQIGTMAIPDNQVVTQSYDNGKKSSEQWLETLESNPNSPVEEHAATVRSKAQWVLRKRETAQNEQR
jgi:hypothetical protein